MFRVFVGLLVCVVALPALAARPRCAEAFRKSCVRKLYRCFDGAGTCQRDFSAFSSGGAITDCWANGTTATLTGFDDGAGTSTLRNRRGVACLQGTTTVAGFDVTIRYQKRKRVWTIHRNLAGDFTITCPTGKTETYPAATVTLGGCGPIADCASGTCGP